MRSSDCRIGRAKRDGPSRASGDPAIQPQPTGGHQRVDRGGGERRRDLEPAPQQLKRYARLERPVGVKCVDDGEDRALVREPRLARHHDVADDKRVVAELGY